MTTDFVRKLLLAMLAPLVFLLASCGGGDGAGAHGPQPEPETPDRIRLVTASGAAAVLPGDRSASLALEAYATDRNGVALPGRIVAFSVDDAQAGVAVQPDNHGVTDAAGKATATLTLTGSGLERWFTVRAAVGELASDPLPVRVVGAATTAQINLVARNGLTMPSDGATPIEIDAYVVDANNNAMANVPVIFVAVDEASPPSVVLQPVDGGRSDDTGRATATLRLGANPQNRNVAVRAEANGVVSANLNIAISGTAITVSGPSTITLSGSQPTEFPVLLTDSSGAGIPDRVLSVVSRLGNQVLTPTVRTDADGMAVAEVRGTRAGTDTLTVSGLGATGSLQFQVSDQSVAFDSRSPVTAPIGSEGVALTVRYSRIGGIPGGTRVSFATTRGVVSPGDADISGGVATVRVSSQQAGPATITATVGGVTASLPFTFYATAPHSATLQATPQIVTANLSGSTQNRSALIAVVRDPAGNPVINRRIAFTAEQDPSGGRIEPAIATTDAAGRAVSSFIAGPNVTPTNAVSITARDLDAPSVVSPPARLTVAGRDLFIRVETDNRVVKVDSPPVYEKRYAAVLTDSAGNGIANARVQAKAVPTAYRLGRWVSLTEGWVQVITGEAPSEDSNYDGFCSPGEDANRDGYLTPGNVAAVSVDSETNAAGIAELVLTYPQGFAMWVEVVLEVSATSAGTESQSSIRFWLPISADDVRDPNTPPPGVISPFPYPAGAGPQNASCG
ncbi:MAG: Ig-like domain-containing protein [Burkholderiaceae bacterium]